ncbi:hypothetical protein ACW95P_00455 [Candidatus Mycoplasma pogonae]
MTELIDTFAWIGLLFLTIQSVPQLINLFTKKDQRYSSHAFFPFILIAAGTSFGVFYGILLKTKYTHIEIANLLSLAIALLTIFMYLKSNQNKNLWLFGGLFTSWVALWIIIIGVFFGLNIYWSNDVIIGIALFFTLFLNTIAFLPFVWQAIKAKDFRDFSFFVLLNSFLFNLSWSLNWLLGKVYEHQGIIAAPAYVFWIIIIFQIAGTIIYAGLLTLKVIYSKKQAATKLQTNQ